MITLKKSLLAGSALLAMGISTASLAAYGLPEAPAPVYNWYFGAFGGLTYTPTITSSVIDPNAGFPFGTASTALSFNNPNWDIGAHIGYRYDPFRFELEYLYQHSKAKHISFDNQAVPASGRLSINSAMVNALYDINFDSAFVPYIGFGIGYTNINDSTNNTLPVTVASGTTFEANYFGTGNGSVSRFGYQALAGVGFKVMENAEINIGYRYFGTNSGNTVRFQNHLFNVGFDYYFM